MREIWVIGGGLAGPEAAWQIAARGWPVRLFEMRPQIPTPAHQTGMLAELVCSNSFKSDLDGSSPHQLKWELRRCGSLLISIADECRVPAGGALAVDRIRFSQEVTRRLEAHGGIIVEHGEVTAIPDTQPAIIASGPLTSTALSTFIQGLTGEAALYFYDAISPIVDSESIQWDRVFRLSRYGKQSLPGGVSPAESCQGPGCAPGDGEEGDYVNCPMTEAEYACFYDALTSAESVPPKEFEKTMFFEGCLPIEELARRGRDTLRFGPMKPTGLIDPRTGQQPYAVVQLRKENLVADAYNLVGFQNHLRYGEQQRVFRTIPGLEQAEFVRLGQMHRNTFINAPRVLSPSLRLKQREGVWFAGQICGVEGYVESIAMGLVAAWNLCSELSEQPAEPFPRATAIGSLLRYLTEADPLHFQPMNINFGLFPTIAGSGGRTKRRARQISAARAALEEFLVSPGRAGRAASEIGVAPR